MTNTGILKKIGTDKELIVVVGQVDPENVKNYGNYNPNNGDKIIFLDVSDDPNDRILLAVSDGVVKNLLQGEQILYAAKDGNMKASIRAKTDGSMVLNDGEDYAVKYSDLKTEFEELKGKFNVVANALTNWTPVFQDGGTALKTLLVPLPPEIPTPLTSTADITKTKVEKVRL